MGRKIVLLVFGIAVLLLILFVLCGELKPLPAVLGGGLLLLFDPLNSRLKNSSLLFRAFVCGVMATGVHCLFVLFNLLPAGMMFSDCRFGWLFALAVWTAGVFRHCCISKCSTALIKVRKAGDKCEIYYIKA